MYNSFATIRLYEEPLSHRTQNRGTSVTGTGGRVVTKKSFSPSPYVRGSQPSLRCSWNFCSTAHMTTRISSIARFLPTQFIGPYENGTNAASLWTKVASSMLEEKEEKERRPEARSQRSGQKSSVLGKKWRASW